MSHNWPKVPLGEVLTKSEEWIILEPNKRYKEVKVRLWGKGVCLRREANGGEIASPRRLLVRENQFILSRIDARNGAFGLIPDSLDGAIVSNDFPVFNLDKAQIDPFFLNWMSKTKNFVDLCIEASEGTTNRVRLQENRFLVTPIPLPLLPEQQRIVARIETLASKVKELQEIREYSDLKTNTLYQSALAMEMKSKDGHWEKETVIDVITSMDAGWSPQCDNRPAKDGEWGVLKTTSVQWCQFRQSENKALPPSLAPRPELCVQEDDVLVTRAGPRKRVGVVAAVRNAKSKLIISDKLIRLRPQKSKIEPRFLELSLASPYSQEHLVQRKTGLADAQVNISQEILRTAPIAYPDLPQQRRIVAYLDDLQAKVEALKKLQAETVSELDAFLPSILDKAFRGEL
ncbi:MAG: restriction endonuclease subunit S [Nitrospirae bacterium]|nr:restriction endonuclease subunit S [Nitrospirota bacterium]